MMDDKFIATLFEYFDPHMKIMILEWYLDKNVRQIFIQIFEKQKILEMMKTETNKTRMISYLINIETQLNPDSNVSEELLLRQTNEEKNIIELQNKFISINNIVSDDCFKNYLNIYSSNEDEVLRTAANHFGIPKNFSSIIIDYCFMLYDIGQYQKCLDILVECNDITGSKTEAVLHSTWGKLSCAIILNDVESAIDYIEAIKTILNTSTFSKTRKISHQAFLLNWSMFVYFRFPETYESFIDLCIRTPSYKHTLETVCPYLLRYIIIIYILIYLEDSDFQLLISLVLQEEYHYSDNFTLFIKALYHTYDMDNALKLIKECHQQLLNDYFLSDISEEFMEKAYLLVFSRFVKLHRSLSVNHFDISVDFALDMLSKYVNMDIDDYDALINTDFDYSMSHQIATLTKQLSQKIINPDDVDLD